MHGVCVQVRMATVLDHVLDTVQHLLKKKVALERAIDPDTPDIIADGSRIVQVCAHAMSLHSSAGVSAVACLVNGEQFKLSGDCITIIKA